MRWTKVVALAAAGALSLAACGGGSSDTSKTTGSSDNAGTSQTTPDTTGTAGATDSPDATDTSGAPATTGAESTGGTATSELLDPAAKGPAPEIPGAQKGGTLTVLTEGAGPNSMDPSKQFWQDTNAISNLFLRRLTTWRLQDGKPTLVPDLAEDLGTASPDGLTWTFKLKKGIKYEDGDPVTAKDFVYAVKRAFDHKTFPAGPAYADDYLKDGDTYKGPITQKGKAFGGVEAPDDHTVVFHLRKKWPTLPYYATFTQVAPVPEAKDTIEKYTDHPIGTGPYKIEKYQKGQALSLVKNPNWDPATDPARHQYIDRFVWQLKGNRDKNTEVIWSSSSDQDAMSLSYDGVPSQLYDKAVGEKKDQVKSDPSPCAGWITMDTRKIPMEVRKALAVAYPLTPIHDVAGDTDLDLVPNHTILPVTMPGFTPYKPVADYLTGEGDGDPARAKDMLTEAGKVGFKIKYYYSDAPEAAKAHELRKKALEEAGFSVEGVKLPREEVRDKREEPNSDANLLQGTGGWCYDWPSGDAVIPPLFTSAVQESGHTAGFLADKGLDADIARVQALPIEQQASEWGKLDEKIMRDFLPVIPDYQSKSTVIFGKKVHNVVQNPHIGFVEFSQLWLG